MEDNKKMKYPDGGRCMGCIKLLDNCTHINFEKQKPMGKADKEGDQPVVCPEWVKNPHTWRIFL